MSTRNPIIQRRAGKKEPLQTGFHDTSGKFVTMAQLAREVNAGWRFFWNRRGGIPDNQFNPFRGGSK